MVGPSLDNLRLLQRQLLSGTRVIVFHDREDLHNVIKRTEATDVLAHLRAPTDFPLVVVDSRISTIKGSVIQMSGDMADAYLKGRELAEQRRGLNQYEVWFPGCWGDDLKMTIYDSTARKAKYQAVRKYAEVSGQSVSFAFRHVRARLVERASVKAT